LSLLSFFDNYFLIISIKSIISAAKGLLEKDFITQSDNIYYVYDRFFQLWLEKTR